MAKRPAFSMQSTLPVVTFWQMVRLMFGLPVGSGYIMVNGMAVPEPCRGPLDVGQKFWVVTITDEVPAYQLYWNGVDLDMIWLSRGLVHLTEEAALIHAHALLSASEVQS